MCGLLNTSDPAQLLNGLRRQPLLAVLRPNDADQARSQLDQLLAAGLLHVELAVTPSSAWVRMATRLRLDFPGLRLGAASVRCRDGLDAAVAAGLSYVVSPIVDVPLLERARRCAVTLVPGVYTPTEISLATRVGAPAVKLFPAVSLGPAYWSSLAGPLAPLPFCIAAGGLTVADVPAWLSAGVDAVALGGSLFDPPGRSPGEASRSPRLSHALRPLLERLARGDTTNRLST
ncbi:MAG: hypothetical protein RLZZ124_964 [Cyanobacteriota bacterium]